MCHTEPVEVCWMPDTHVVTGGYKKQVSRIEEQELTKESAENTE